MSAHIHCKEISIYVFPEKELRVLSPNFHIHVSVSDLYISTIGPFIFLQQNMQTDRGNTYIIRTQTHECRNWDCGRSVPFLGIYISNFRYSIFAVSGKKCSASRIFFYMCTSTKQDIHVGNTRSLENQNLILWAP